MSKVSKEIMNKVAKGKVAKIPKWRFVMRQIFIWGSLVVAVLMGAFAMSMIMVQLFSVDWDVLPKMGPGPVRGFIAVMPYFWVLVSALLFSFVYFDFKKTRKGYRYDGRMVISVSVLVALILGIGLYVMHTPERAEEFFMKSSMYRGIHHDPGMLWIAPEKGLLGGKVIEVQGMEIIILEDFSNDTWRVDVLDARYGKGYKKEVINGDYLKIIGEMLKRGEFRADEIRFLKFR